MTDAMKDVADCEKPAVGVSNRRPLGIRMGKPNLTEAFCEASAGLDYSAKEGINL